MASFTFTQPVEATVALHYHRATEPRQREGLAARRLLAAVPGITVVEFEPDARWGRTCTPALQEQLGPDVWRQMVLDDTDRALAAGATHMAGIYHGCHREQCRFETERPIVVEHYLTLFARALGIEFEDTYKKYVHMGDPDRILEDATPCMAANGVDRPTRRAGSSSRRSPPSPGHPTMTTTLVESKTLFAAEDDVPIPYMQRTRDYYQALGFSPYRWAHFAEVPFTPLATPLAGPASR